MRSASRSRSRPAGAPAETPPYRDIIRTSLILDAKFLVLLMPITYRVSTGTARATTVPAYRDARAMLEAIYASRRLPLPFEGVLLVGY